MPEPRFDQRLHLAHDLIDAAREDRVAEELRRRLASRLGKLRRRDLLGDEVGEPLELLAERVAKAVAPPQRARQQHRQRGSRRDRRHLVEHAAAIGAERNLDLHRRLERREGAAGGRRGVVNALEPLAVLRGAHLDRRVPAVGEAAGQTEHLRRVRRDPDDGRLAAVERCGEEGAVEAPERSVERHRLAAALPEPPDDGERLLEARDALGERDAVRRGVLALAVADAEDRAAAGQVVERDEGLGKRRRMAAEGLGDAGADPDPAIARSHHPHHHEGIEEGVGRRNDLRCRRRLGVPHRTRHEAQVVVRQQQRVDAHQLEEPQADALELQRGGAVALDADRKARVHGCLLAASAFRRQASQRTSPQKRASTRGGTPRR